MRVRFTADAEAEAQAALLGYEQRRQALGVAFSDSLTDAVEMILESPRRFPRDDSVGRRREVRFLTIARFPYMVVYEVQEHELIVLAIAHLHRRPGYWKGRKG